MLHHNIPLTLVPPRAPSSYTVSFPSAQPVLFLSYSWTLRVPVLSNRTCVPSVWTYSLLVVIVTHLIVPYSYGRTLFPSVCPYSPIILVGPMCAPILFRLYLWPLRVNRILSVLIVALPCVPYYSVHTCDLFECPVLFRTYSWNLRLSCTLVLILVAPMCSLYPSYCTCGPLCVLGNLLSVFLQYFIILTRAQAQRFR